MGSVEQWFQGDKDYQKGVELFESISDNVLILRMLKRNDSQSNRDHLEYELSKFLPADEKKVVPQTREELLETKNIPVVEIVENSIAVSEKKNMLLFADLPPELRPVLEQANQSFRKLCLLKTELNEVPDDEEEKALKIQIEMDKLRKENEMCWSKIDHFLETGKLLSVSNDKLSSLSPVQLVKTQQLQFQKVSKDKKAIKSIVKLIEVESNQVKKQKLALKLEKAKEKLLTDEDYLLKINTLVNG